MCSLKIHFWKFQRKIACVTSKDLQGRSSLLLEQKNSHHRRQYFLVGVPFTVAALSYYAVIGCTRRISGGLCTWSPVSPPLQLFQNRGSTTISKCCKCTPSASNVQSQTLICLLKSSYGHLARYCFGQLISDKREWHLSQRFRIWVLKYEHGSALISDLASWFWRMLGSWFCGSNPMFLIHLVFLLIDEELLLLVLLYHKFLNICHK